MQFKSQKDPAWANARIGQTSLLIKNYGCLICCFASLLEVDPREIAKGDYFDANGLMVSQPKVAKDFGGEYSYFRDEIVWNPVICETRFDGSMHFVLKDGDRILDPLSLDGHPLRDYKILSYRNVRKLPKEDDMIPQEKLTDRFYHTSDGKALYWIPDPETGNKYLPGWADNKPVDSIVPEISQLHAQIDDLTIRLKTLEDTKNDLQTQVSNLSTEKQQIGDKTREELYNQFTMEKDLLTKEHDNEVENITESYSLKIQQLEDELKKKETCKQSTGQSNTGKTLLKSILDWLASHR
jgi:hypothetical protein